jgi:putative DNA primase/helicase
MRTHIEGLTKTQRKETTEYIELLCPKDTEPSGANLIAFKNGIYDINTGTLSDFSPDVIITNKIPHNYSPTAYDYNVDSVLNKLSCGDMSIRAILEEAVGYSFYRRSELSKAFIFTGNKANGKSTFLTMLQNCLGEGNYCSLDIAEFGDRFSTEVLTNKLANIGDDIGTAYLPDKAVSMFKKITSGNTIKAERKGEPAFQFKPYAKLFFSTNDLAQMKDPTGAVLRRLVIIPMNASFTKSDPDYDPYIISKLTSESAMEYLIKLAIEGLKRVLSTHDFTESDAANTKLSEYEVTNDHFLEWLINNEIDEDYMLREPITTIFRSYNVWCVESGYEQWSTTKFGAAVKNRFGLKSKVKKIDGKSIRFYIK